MQRNRVINVPVYMIIDTNIPVTVYSILCSVLEDSRERRLIVLTKDSGV